MHVLIIRVYLLKPPSSKKHRLFGNKLSINKRMLVNFKNYSYILINVWFMFNLVNSNKTKMRRHTQEHVQYLEGHNS